MSDPIARPQKRMATLVGAGIAAMLSPSGKIISSAAAASLIVAAVATQVIDSETPATIQMASAPDKQAMALPVSHVAIETGGGEIIPVMMSETVSEESGVTPIEVGGSFQSGVPTTPTGGAASPAAVSPPVIASAPPPTGWQPPFLPPAPPNDRPPEPNAPPQVPDEILTDLGPLPTNPPGTPTEQDPEPKDSTACVEGECDEEERNKDACVGNECPEFVPNFPPRIASGPAEQAQDRLPDETSPIARLTPLAVAVVPEPGMLGLMMLGLGGLALSARRRPRSN